MGGGVGGYLFSKIISYAKRRYALVVPYHFVQGRGLRRRLTQALDQVRKRGNLMAHRLIWIASLYLVLGATLGLYMGATENFTLAPVHAHILLAGWLSLAMAGVVYRLYPAASDTRLANAHFWLHNLGLPIFMVGLASMLTGHNVPALIPVGGLSFFVGLLCFSINVWRRVRG